jgi:hypothetical protein
MPGRALVVLASVAVASLLGSCSATDLPTPRRTVTVVVDAPTATGTPSRTSGPVPTQTAPAPSPTTSSPSTSPVPTALSVGRHRGAPTSFDAAKERINSTTRVADGAPGIGAGFRSPSGNLVCAAGTGETRLACEVAKGRVAPPLPTICPSDGPKDIGRIELRREGAVPVCNSDTIRTGREAELAYGTRTPPGGPLACLSETSGVTCIDAAGGHGFFLARDTFVTF